MDKGIEHYCENFIILPVSCMSKLYLLFLRNDLDEIIDFLLSRPKNIDKLVSPEVYENLLISAIERERIDIVIILMELGCNVNFQDKYGNSPLHICCRKNNINKDILERLVNAGANGLLKTEDGYTALHYAALFTQDVDIIRILIPISDPNTVNRCKNTPLTLACINNKNIEIIKILIGVTNDINTKNNMGITGLHWLCIRNKHDML